MDNIHFTKFLLYLCFKGKVVICTIFIIYYFINIRDDHFGRYRPSMANTLAIKVNNISNFTSFNNLFNVESHRTINKNVEKNLKEI